MSDVYFRLLMSSSLFNSGGLVVALGGVTNGGKTTTCQALEKYFSSEKKNIRLKVFHLDDYYRSIDDPQHIYLDEYKTQDWECLSALNIDRFLDDLKRSRDEFDLILVEGFLIFNIPFESNEKNLFDLSYIFDLPFDECFRRRSQRNYDPPDPEGYFQGHVWPSYLKMKQDALERHKNSSLKVIDTTQKSFETIHNEIINDILCCKTT